MAYTMRNGDWIVAKFACRDAAQNGLNILHYRVSSLTGTAPTDAQVAAALDTIAAPLYKAFLPPPCTYQGSSFQVFFPLPVEPAQIYTLNAGVGLRASSPIPSQASMLVTKLTLASGRSGRGRVYLPFWSILDTDTTGKPTAAGLVLANNWATTMLEPIPLTIGGGSITLTPIIYNRAANSVRDVSSFVVRTQWATQRRRSEINRSDSPFP